MFEKQQKTVEAPANKSAFDLIHVKSWVNQPTTQTGKPSSFPYMTYMHQGFLRPYTVYHLLPESDVSLQHLKKNLWMSGMCQIGSFPKSSGRNKNS